MALPVQARFTKSYQYYFLQVQSIIPYTLQSSV